MEGKKNFTSLSALLNQIFSNDLWATANGSWVNAESIELLGLLGPLLEIRQKTAKKPALLHMPQEVGAMLLVSPMNPSLLKMCHTPQLLYTLRRYVHWTSASHMKGSLLQRWWNNQGRWCSGGQPPEGEGKRQGKSMGPFPMPSVIAAAASQEITL